MIDFQVCLGFWRGHKADQFDGDYGYGLNDSRIFVAEESQEPVDPNHPHSMPYGLHHSMAQHVYQAVTMSSDHGITW